MSSPDLSTEFIIFLLFLACSGILALYYLFSIIPILFYNRKFNASSRGVSVVICAHFEFENLQKLLPNLLKQKHNKFEIIVVDDRSEDGTYDYLRELENQYDNIKHVRIDRAPDHISEKKFAISLGIKAAQHEIILLTDADCIPGSDKWITKMTAPFSKKNIQMVIGASLYQKNKGLVNLLTRYETLVTGLMFSASALYGNPYMGLGRNLAYRKSFFLDKNGFGKHKHILGGDDDLFVNANATKDNTTLILDKQATTLTYSETSWRSYAIQKKRHLSVGKYYKWADKLFIGFIQFVKLFFWLTFFAAILSQFEPIYTLIAFVTVMVLLLVSLSVYKFKVGERTRLWLLPFLEFIYLIYYLSVGLKVTFTKKIRWN